MNKKNIISLEKLLINGPTVESYEDIKQSIYEDIYKSAKRQVENIVSANKEYIQECRKGKKRTFEGSNVISFVGRRGTGKTSAMLSFAGILEEYTREGKYAPVRDFFENQGLMEKTGFYSLDVVDASALDQSEDVFLIVLSNMFDKAELIGKDKLHKISEFDNRQLFQKFEKVYNDFVTLSQNMKIEDEYAAFEKLRKISGSQKIRESFADLVKEFLRINTKTYSEGYDQESSYLTIMIDDLDMTYGNTGNGTYKVMNAIYKYMRVPNVIVLTTYNDQKLLTQCNDYFTGEKVFNTQIQSFYEEQQQTAVEFIEKVIPVFARVYMPSWKKRDFENNIMICTNKSILEIPDCMRDHDIITKKFLFLLLAERTGIFFDIQGKKHHFFETETLRELYNRVQFLLSLKNRESSVPIDEILSYNIKKLKEDCYFRFKEEKLINKNERYFFESLLEETLERRGDKLIYHICYGIEKLGKRAKRMADKTGNISFLDNHQVSYSYAELIHGIYHLTRNSAENDNLCSSRQFVAVLLYSYTIQLTDLYTRYRSYKKKLGKTPGRDIFRHPITEEDQDFELKIQLKELYNLLKNVIGHGVCCQWAEYFFPEIQIGISVSSPERLTGTPKVGPYIMGYIESGFSDFGMLSLTIINTEEEPSEKLFKRVQLFLFKAMLFTNALEWTKDDIVWNEKDAASGEKINLLTINLNPSKVNFQNIYFLNSGSEKNTPDNGDFDVTGIFKYSFCYEEFLENIESIILTSLKESKKVNDSIYENIKQKLQKCMDRIWEEWEKWDRTYGNMMLPLYSMDITYNIIKRVFQESLADKRETLLLKDNKEKDSQDIFCVINEYKIMLDHFKKHLILLDEWYSISGNKEDSKLQTNFTEAFVQCPVYQFIEKNSSDPEIAKELYAFFYRIAIIQKTAEMDFFPPLG